MGICRLATINNSSVISLYSLAAKAGGLGEFVKEVKINKPARQLICDSLCLYGVKEQHV